MASAPLPAPVDLARTQFLALAATVFDQACPAVPKVQPPLMGRMGLPAPVGMLLIALREVMTPQPPESLCAELERIHRGLATTPPEGPAARARPRP